MPRILEVRDIDGELWVRVGKPEDFLSGVTLWTLTEKKDFRNSVLKHAVQVAEETFRERNIVSAIRGLMS